VLANLFLHYAFDAWMRRTFPSVPFERYADDVIAHCASLAHAERVLAAIRERLAACGLVLHPDKTRIVYCKDGDRSGSHEHESFDFLGYTFRPRKAKSKDGRFFISFLPAVSDTAAKAARQQIRRWRLHCGPATACGTSPHSSTPSCAVGSITTGASTAPGWSRPCSGRSTNT
jgi:RNA-directed DNA polymerase